MSAHTPSVSAVIRLVNAPPALRIDVVDPDPPPVLLLRPSAGWARSSAGPLLLDPRPHSESRGPECATTWSAVRRCVALRSSIPGVACRDDGCLPPDGRARSESVSAPLAMADCALSVELKGLPFSLWTHVTFKHPSRMGRLVLKLIVTSSQMTVSPSSTITQSGDN